ncbi:MAG: ABC transporter ATP-binding protein [bacterium]
MTEATQSDGVLLRVEDLVCEFHTEQGPARAVDRVSFTLGRGQTVGLVGESGCGKSATALAIMGLLPRPTGRVTGGRVLFDGLDLLSVGERRLRDLRGNRLAMIFQEPMTALNPVMKSGEQVAEVLRRHRGLDRRQAWDRTVALFSDVGIPAPEQRVGDYPHQLSGGMRQRVLIAMAIACEPELLIADEPTTALDVTIQAQILDLLRSLRRRTGLSMLLITHDLGVVAQTCEQVLVMYAGQLVEQASAEALFAGPRHPYTIGLLGSTPRRAPGAARQRLPEIPGSVPPITRRPDGCQFAERCDRSQRRCTDDGPALRTLVPGHRVACHFPVDRDAAPGATDSGPEAAEVTP